MSSIKQRAVSSEQKQQRISQILDAAANQFSHQDYIDIRLVDIASDVGITKAALYRYFRTKETLFLALYEQQLNLLGERAKDALASEALVPALKKAILSAVGTRAKTGFDAQQENATVFDSSMTSIGG